MDYPQFIGPYYTSFASKAESESCKNLYLELIESGQGRNQFAMYRSPGLRTFAHNFNPSKLVCRGLFVDPTNNHLFVIEDDTMSDILADGTQNPAVPTLQPIANDGQLVSIDSSLNSLFLVSANILYRVNSAALMTPVTPFTPTAVVVLSGLVIAVAVGTNQFYFSTDDGVTWPALNFQVAEAYPNSLINAVVDHQELWLFGNRRTQVFVLGPDPNAPMQPVSSGVIEMGLAAKNAVAKLDNSIFWLGRNKDGERMVWRANGYTPTRVSNHAVENQFRTYPDDSDASMQTYQLNGHSCLRLTFPSANNGLGATWEYDVSTNNWYEIAWWNPMLNHYERHRGNCYASAFQKIVVGDYANGELYYMSPDYYTDFGYPIRWNRKTPHSSKDGKRIQYKRFGIFMQTGVGTATPVWLNDHSIDPVTFAAALATAVAATTITQPQSNAMQAIYNYQTYNPDFVFPEPAIMTTFGFYDYGANPHVEMRYSNDGGTSYGPWRSRAMGRAGATNKRIYWGGITGLGQSRDRVWEVSGIAPVKTAIVQASFDALVCDS